MVYLPFAAIINYIKIQPLTVTKDGKLGIMIFQQKIGKNSNQFMPNQVILIYLLEVLCRNPKEKEKA